VNIANTGTPPPPPPGAPVVDKVVSVDATGTATTAAFSTTGSNELLLAFVSADGSVGQTATVTGAGLNWTIVKRANGRAGTAEVWQARATNPLSNVTVRSTLGSNAPQSVTVVSFRNAAVGASTSAGALNGPPTVSLTTTQPDSWLYGTGSDPDAAIARGQAAGQTMLHQWVNTSGGMTAWVEASSATIPSVNTGVALVDNSPTANQWNFAGVEVVPAVVISNPVVLDRTPSSARVVWTTTVPASSKVLYGTTPGYGNQVVDSSLVITHQITLTGLQPQTTYHYQIISQDANGQTGTSVDFMFGTPAISDIACTIVSPTAEPSCQIP